MNAMESPLMDCGLASQEKAPQSATSLISQLPWRGQLRLFAVIGNSTMVLYVYCAHLLGVEWGQFGQFRAVPEGHSRSVRDYLSTWDIDPVFDQLRLFTFSEAMLENLSIYMLVGAPVAMTMLFLEYGRIRWFQRLLAESLPESRAKLANSWLELYLWALSTCFFFILAIGPFHLELPRAHYFCAACALSFGFVSMLLYLTAPVDLRAVAAATGRDDVMAWSSQVQSFVRPGMKCVLAMHALVLGAAIWKAEKLGDDRLALLFGVLETMLVLGYQLFAALFIVDDVMIGKWEKAGSSRETCMTSLSDS